MAYVKGTTTGDKYLRKHTTEADKGAGSALQTYEKQVGSDGAASNTVYTLGTPYAPGSNTLVIFINGQKAEKVTSATDSTEYEETNQSQITFGDSLLDGDVIEFIIFGAYIFDNVDLAEYTLLTTYNSHAASASVHFTEASIDHGSISGLEDDDHPQYMTDVIYNAHAASASVHFTEASIDHGSIVGLEDDDHPQYMTDVIYNAHAASAAVHFTEAEIDHTSILNIGTNTHAELDSHVASAAVHFTTDAIDTRVASVSAASEQYTDGEIVTSNAYTDTQIVSVSAASEQYTNNAVHTQGTDTTLGTMTADIDMDSSFQVVGLQAPDASGQALRQTTNITEADLEQLTDGSDTTLHDHDGISENTGARHTQGTDTTLGTVTADIDMDNSYQVVNLQAPANAGEALRQTVNITEADLEQLTDGSDTTLHDHDGISENTGARHAESHTVVSHSDTTATGAELNTLTDNSVANTLHRHSELVASDGAPDPAFSINSTGYATFPAGTGINEFSIDDTLGGNSDNAVPTEQAVKAYADTKLGLSAKAADSSLLNNAVESVNESNNTIVKRDSNGYIHNSYFNTSPDDIGDGLITKLLAESGDDGYMRHAAAGVVRTFLNVEDGATAGVGLILPRGYIDGFQTRNDADTAHDIEIGIGQARCDADDENIIFTAVKTKRIDAGWGAGDNGGGMDTGSVAANDWYHIYLIYNPSTQTSDALFTKTYGSPTMPGGYTKKRRIGAVRTNVSSNIIAYSQVGDEFLWDDPPLDVSVTNQPASAVSRTLSVPTGLQVISVTNIYYLVGNNTLFYVSPLDVNDEAPSQSVAPLAEFATNQNTRDQNRMYVRTNTSSQIRGRASNANATVRIATLGWLDQRGTDE